MTFYEDTKHITRSEFSEELTLLQESEEPETVYGIFEDTYMDVDHEGVSVLVKNPRVILSLVDFDKGLVKDLEKSPTSFSLKRVSNDEVYKVKAFEDDGQGISLIYLERDEDQDA